MAEISQQIEARARKIESEIVRGLDSVSRAQVAALLGIDASTVTRMTQARQVGGKEEPSFLRQMANFLAAADRKVVAYRAEVFESERIEALRVLAKIGLDHAGTPSGFGDEL